MNFIGIDVIKLISFFLNTYDLRYFRLSSKLMCKITSTVFFSRVAINIDKINETNINDLRNLVKKYNFLINIICTKRSSQLSFFSYFHVKSVNVGTYFDDYNWYIYIPATTKELTFGFCFNQEIDLIPLELKSLHFEPCFDKKININKLPTTLESLTCNISNIEGKLTLKNLTLYMNKNISTNIFSQVQNLKLVDDYSSNFMDSYTLGLTINLPPHLPNNLQTLQLNNMFNQIITENHPQGESFTPVGENILPTTLTELIFGQNFNTLIYEKALPSSLTSLKFGGKYNQLINYILPINLKYLEFGHDFNQYININTLKNLTELKFGTNFNKQINTLPINLKTLIFGDNFNENIKNYPRLETLIFGKYFNKQLKNLPDSLQILIFGHNYNKSLNNLPNNLKTLILGESYKKQLNNLPNNLNKLVLDYTFNEKIIIPKNLQYLTIGYGYTHKLLFPSCFRKLYYCDKYNKIPYPQ